MSVAFFFHVPRNWAFCPYSLTPCQNQPQCFSWQRKQLQNFFCQKSLCGLRVRGTYHHHGVAGQQLISEFSSSKKKAAFAKLVQFQKKKYWGRMKKNYRKIYKINGCWLWFKNKKCSKQGQNGPEIWQSGALLDQRQTEGELGRDQKNNNLGKRPKTLFNVTQRKNYFKKATPTLNYYTYHTYQTAARPFFSFKM